MSTLEVSNLNDGTTTLATTYITNGSAKVWMNYNGQTNTIRSSLNTTSVTDNATGDFKQNISSSMDTDDNTCVVTGKTNQNSNAGNALGANCNSSGTEVNMVVYEDGTKRDASNIFTLVVGDLA